MTPYYEDDHVTIYHGDSTELVPDLDLTFDAIVADPPYGLGLNHSNESRGRTALAAAHDHPDVAGDDEPFDPTWLLAFDVPTVLFGANHYASRLPDASCWLAWDKLDGLRSDRDVGFNDSADVELAWTNLGGPARLFAHRWMGAMRNGRDRTVPRRHPTEKPVELLTWCLAQIDPDAIVLDPYMGSGPTLRAAKDLGRRAIGIEKVERYCEIAAGRCRQEVLF